MFALIAAAQSDSSGISSGWFALAGVVAGSLVTGILTLLTERTRARHERASKSRERIALAATEFIEACREFRAAQGDLGSWHAWSLGGELTKQESEYVRAEASAKRARTALAVWVDRPTRHAADELYEAAEADHAEAEAGLMDLIVRTTQ
jgi:hypothetical protein